MGVNSLPKTVTWQHRNCDLNPGPFVPESSMLTIRLLSHPLGYRATRSAGIIAISGLPTWWSIVFVKEISESLPLLTVLLFAKFLLQLNCRLCRCLRPISFHIICHLSLSTFWSCIRRHWQNIESVQTFFACCFLCTVKCEPKAMLVGCNAGITAVDIDLDVSAALHCTDMADAELYAVK